MKEAKPYITHFCKNTKEYTQESKKSERVYLCNNAWLDVDLFNGRKPVTWKLCKECAGDDFENQKPRAVNQEIAKRLKEAKERKAS